MTGKTSFTSRIVTGIFSDSMVAGNAIVSLINAGFERRNLSVIGTDSDKFREITAQLTKSGPDMCLIYGSLIGTIFGAVCGLYSIEFMPAAKYFMSIIPLMAALTGAAAGAYFGLLVGGLTHFDTPTYEANVKTEADKKNILVSVSVKNTELRFKAEDILEKCGADEVLVVQPQEEHSASTASTIE